MLCENCTKNKVCYIAHAIVNSKIKITISQCEEHEGKKTLSSALKTDLSVRMERMKQIQQQQKDAEPKEECTMCHKLKPTSEIIKCTNCRRLICIDCACVDIDKGPYCDSCYENL